MDTKTRQTKNLEFLKDKLIEAGHRKEAQRVTDKIKQIKQKQEEDKKQKNLLELDAPNSKEEIVIRTHLRTCSSCGKIFRYPGKDHRPKCILCKIENGSLSEAKKDLDRYYASDINQKIEKLILQ